MWEARRQRRTLRRYPVVATVSRHTEPIAPNRSAESSVPTKLDEVRVADITDITDVPTAEG